MAHIEVEVDGKLRSFDLQPGVPRVFGRAPVDGVRTSSSPYLSRAAVAVGLDRSGRLWVRSGQSHGLVSVTRDGGKDVASLRYGEQANIEAGVYVVTVRNDGVVLRMRVETSVGRPVAGYRPVGDGPRTATAWSEELVLRPPRENRWRTFAALCVIACETSPEGSAERVRARYGRLTGQAVVKSEVSRQLDLAIRHLGLSVTANEQKAPVIASFLAHAHAISPEVLSRLRSASAATNEDTLGGPTR